MEKAFAKALPNREAACCGRLKINNKLQNTKVNYYFDDMNAVVLRKPFYPFPKCKPNSVILFTKSDVRLGCWKTLESLLQRQIGIFAPAMDGGFEDTGPQPGRKRL
jgi:hypothetical protein